MRGIVILLISGTTMLCTGCAGDKSSEYSDLSGGKCRPYSITVASLDEEISRTKLSGTNVGSEWTLLGDAHASNLDYFFYEAKQAAGKHYYIQTGRSKKFRANNCFVYAGKRSGPISMEWIFRSEDEKAVVSVGYDEAFELDTIHIVSDEEVDGP